jgi:hypothetical protein
MFSQKMIVLCAIVRTLIARRSDILKTNAVLQAGVKAYFLEDNSSNSSAGVQEYVQDASVRYLWQSWLETDRQETASENTSLVYASPWESDGGPLSASKKKLGEGAFGVATLHTLIRAPCKDMPVVVKTIPYYTSEACTKAFEEIDMMKKFQHPHIIRMYDYMPRACTEDIGEIYLLLEAAMGGELEKAFNQSAGGLTGDIGRLGRFLFGGIPGVKAKRQAMKGKLVKMIVHDILDGLRHMHAQQVVHRDIKPNNIWAVASAAASCMETMTCRFVLGDLGFAATLQEGKAHYRAGTAFFLASRGSQDSALDAGRRRLGSRRNHLESFSGREVPPTLVDVERRQDRQYV